MVVQRTILDDIAAAKLAEEGIENAVTNAERFFPSWKDKALVVLKSFLLEHGHNPFLVEQIRKYAEKTALPAPPSERAWGGVVRMAVTNGWIERVGYAKTSNVKAHGTPASLWMVVKNKT